MLFAKSGLLGIIIYNEDTGNNRLKRWPDRDPCHTSLQIKLKKPPAAPLNSAKELPLCGVFNYTPCRGSIHFTAAINRRVRLIAEQLRCAITALPGSACRILAQLSTYSLMRWFKKNAKEINQEK